MTSTRHGKHPVEVPDDVETLDWPEYRYLAPWLRIALWGLSTDARARLREEIGSHFNDALAEGIQRGLSEDTAGKRAVESLGSPRIARLRFYRAYLTKIEQHNLERIRNLDRGAFLFFGLVCATNAARLFMEPRWSWPDWELRAALVALGAAALLGMGVMSALARRGHLRAAVVVAALAFPGFYVSWVSQHRPNPFEAIYSIDELLLVLVGGMLLIYLSLFLKLPSHTERA